MLLRAFFLPVLESALTRFINLDPDALPLLEPLAGHVVRIDLQPAGWSFFLCPTHSGVQLLEDWTGEPDTVLSGSPLAFAAMGLSNRPMNMIFAGEVEIHGNTAVGHAIQKLFARLDIDWEEQLSTVCGDVLAHKIGNLVRSAGSRGQESLQSARLTLGEYFTEETRDLPTRYECDALMSAIDTARADVDRLQARIERLQQSAEATDPAAGAPPA